MDVFDEAYGPPDTHRGGIRDGLAAVFAYLGQQDSDDDPSLRLRCLELAVEWETAPGDPMPDEAGHGVFTTALQFLDFINGDDDPDPRY